MTANESTLAVRDALKIVGSLMTGIHQNVLETCVLLSPSNLRLQILGQCGHCWTP